MESVAGMGFPAPRVARAVRRFSGNHTQVSMFILYSVTGDSLVPFIGVWIRGLSAYYAVA